MAPPRIPLIGIAALLLSLRQEVPALESHAFPHRPLVFVTPGSEPDGALPARARAALEGGATHVLLRRPQANARTLYEMARELSPITRRAGAVLVIADRLDVALAIEGAGVQLGATSLPPDASRAILPGRPMGVSVHSRDEARVASAAGADWVIAGNIYDTATHPERPGKGTGWLRDIAGSLAIPVIAIGGITPSRVPEVIATGAAGIAVIRAISDATDPREATRVLRDALDHASGELP